MLTNDDIRRWLQGFVDSVGESQAKMLLDRVGQLEPKVNNQTKTFLPKMASNERCAILFFGLPRSFKDLVLPSVEANLMTPNARYNCDFFVRRLCAGPAERRTLHHVCVCNSSLLSER